MGSEVIATLKVGKKTLTAEAFSGWMVDEGFSVAAGEMVWVTLDQNKLHLFDSETEQAVL
jgi:hypothetical protein